MYSSCIRSNSHVYIFNSNDADARTVRPYLLGLVILRPKIEEIERNVSHICVRHLPISKEKTQRNLHVIDFTDRLMMVLCVFFVFLQGLL